jgi:hypothetical protein
MNITSNKTSVSNRAKTLIASPAAYKELKWFFNGAEREIDMPSTSSLVFGMSPTSMAAVERRLEAAHAAGKIGRWLEALPPGCAGYLRGRYMQRPLPATVTRTLGKVAGVVVELPVVRMKHVQALTTVRTKARTVPLWLAELIEKRGPAAVSEWKRSAWEATAIALTAYEHVRGDRECVVPSEFLKEVY